MAQLLAVATMLTLAGWMSWRYISSAREQQQRQPAAPRRAFELERRVDKASAQDFLRGAADLTFGMVIFGLGFFMLMWVIATA